MAETAQRGATPKAMRICLTANSHCPLKANQRRSPALRFYAVLLPALLAMQVAAENLAFDHPWLADALGTPSVSDVADDQIAILTPKPEPWQAQNLTASLGNRQKFTQFLSRYKVHPTEAAQVTTALQKVYPVKNIKAGQNFDLNMRQRRRIAQVDKIVFKPDAFSKIELTRQADNSFSAQKIARTVTNKTLAGFGVVRTSLSAAMNQANVPRTALAEFIKNMSYDVDFQRDISAGNTFAILYEGTVDDEGKVIKTGKLLFAALRTDDDLVAIYRNNDNKFYQADGAAIQKAFMRTPVDAAHVTSGFGFRIHPLLGFSKMHKGVDFGAPTGTPIFAAADGVVEKAAPFSGYGNYVRIKHNATYSTAYAHMSRYAANIRPGARVVQGQVIGYVGMTGSATGPHLHFEVVKGGEQVNPTAVTSIGSNKLLGKDYAQFASLVKQRQQQFAQLAGTTNKFAFNDTGKKVN